VINVSRSDLSWYCKLGQYVLKLSTNYNKDEQVTIPLGHRKFPEHEVDQMEIYIVGHVLGQMQNSGGVNGIPCPTLIS
jgi:hypothetical protein